MSDTTLEPSPPEYLDIVFDGEPGPISGSFVEVEGPNGHSVRLGDWVRRPDGYWALRFTVADMHAALARVLDKDPTTVPVEAGP